MAAGVAHEIGNPLGGIELQASLLARDASGDGARRADKILIAARRLGRIVTDMLTFTRDRPITARPCPLARTAGEAADLVVSLLEERSVRVEVDCPEDLTVMADEELLLQALHNLLDNAIRFSPEGAAVTVAAEIGSGPFRPEVACRVRDRGPGISEEIMPHVFNPFFSRRDGGTGLGLAIAHKVIADCGGKLTCENAREGGAVFTIELPATP
jgi:signal transduction histidine kinase